jgi:hypothetical protein
MAAMNSGIILLAARSIESWPDHYDRPILLVYLLLVLGLPAVGYVAMALDFRAYLRSLRRALVLVTTYRRELPEWVRRTTPHCLLALGLTMPCTADDVLAAYRRRVKRLHPDRGGNRREFLRLQEQFEQAMAIVASDR